MSSATAASRPAVLTAQLYPQQALGWFVLGASLHEVLTRIKAEPQRFPKIELYFNKARPVTKEVIVGLPASGLRLQFDGPEQRLRMIEVVDFTKIHITYKPGPNEKERDLIRPTPADSKVKVAKGPTFRHIYQHFLGPTFDGEYIGNTPKPGMGIYVLSYPGVAFNFTMAPSVYSSGKDNVALMSSSGSQVASSMAVFAGESWKKARSTIWTADLPSVKNFAPLNKGKGLVPDEVSLVKLHGGGKVQMFRSWSDKSTWITLGQTTEQDLIIAFGPPDAKYYKNDPKMAIHKDRAASTSRSRQGSNRNNDINSQFSSLQSREGVLTDTDQSSAHSASASDGYDSSEEAVDDNDDGESDDLEDQSANVSTEVFYNYFYLGFDILVSEQKPHSPPAPTLTAELAALPPSFEYDRSDRLVATKVILHSNVPGSYPFNRHRRCRWEIPYVKGKGDKVINSEMHFDEIEPALRKEWREYLPEDQRDKRQKGMVINRGWGDSPGSSIELLGGWEEGVNDRNPSGGGPGGKKFDGGEESTSTIYMFPGLGFEVLRNGYVSGLTVF